MNPRGEKLEKPSRALWAAVLLPPLLWIAQGTIGWYVGGHGCPAVEPAWSPRTVRVSLQLLTALSLVVVAVALGLAHRHRRQNQPANPPSATAERARFVATLAMVAGITLSLGLALAALPTVMVQTCGQAR